MSRVHIPVYLSTKPLPSDKRNVLASLKEKNGWTTYGDITESALESVYSTDFQNFWTVVKYLAFQGVSFPEKLDRFRFEDPADGVARLVVLPNGTDGVLDYDFKYAFLKMRLISYGIYTKNDLHVVPLNHIVPNRVDLNVVSDLLRDDGFDVMTADEYLDKQVFYDSQSTQITFKFQGKTYYFDRINDAPLFANEAFEGDGLVVQYLKKDGVNSIAQIPRDLDFLLRRPGVGVTKVERFLASMSRLNFRTWNYPITDINTIRLSFKGQSYSFHSALRGESLASLDLSPGLHRLVERMSRVGISNIGDLPVELEVIQRRYTGIGTGKILGLLKALRSFEASKLNFNQFSSDHTQDKGDRKLISIGDDSVWVDSSMLERPINPDTFPRTKALAARLQIMGYEFVYQLPKDISFVLEIKQVSMRTASKFLDALRGGDETIVIPSLPIEEFNGERIRDVGYVELFEYATLDVPGEVQESEVTSVASGKSYTLFTRYGMQSIGDLPTKLDKFLLEHKIPEKEVYGVSVSIYKKLTSKVWTRDLVNTLDRICRKERSAGISEREWEILVLRSGGKTLQEVGDAVSLTRERVRQILKKRAKAIFARFQPLLKEWRMLIQRNGFCHISDLLEVDSSQLLPGLRLLQTAQDSIKVHYPWVYLKQKDYEKGIDRFFGSLLADDRVDATFTREEVQQYVTDFFGIDTEVHLSHATEELLNHALVLEGNKYVPVRKMTKAQMCELVFEREFPNGHYIYKDVRAFRCKLESYYPGIFEEYNDRSIIANLTRNESVLLWGLGFFKHQRHLHPEINKEFIQPVKEWLDTQFVGDITQLSAALPFRHFEAYLQQYDIENEHALYSLLRLFYPDAYNYSRSPNIVLQGHKRSEKRILLESYVQSQGGKVSREEALLHCVSKLGWKPFMVDFTISASEELFVSKDQSLIHAEFLNIDQGLLGDIRAKALYKLREVAGSYSVDGLFEDHGTLMKIMNIPDGKVLYQVLERYLSSDFDFHQYPHITEKGRFDEDEVSMHKQFEMFFIDYGDYVLREELREEFLDKRKWSESSYYSAFQSTKGKIVEIFPDEFVHVDVIGWNHQKQTQLESLLNHYWKEKWASANYLSVEKQIFLDDFVMTLPHLDPQFYWTPELLISLMALMDSFLLLGYRKKVALQSQNSKHLKNDIDFVSFVIREEFEGVVKLPQLHRHLTSIGLFTGSAFPLSYLPRDDVEFPYVQAGDELISRELLVRQ